MIVNNFHCFPGYQAGHLTTVTILFGSVLFLKCTGSCSRYISVIYICNIYNIYNIYNLCCRVTLPLFLSLALYSLAPFAHWISLSSLLENTNVTDTVSSTAPGTSRLY